MNLIRIQLIAIIAILASHLSSIHAAPSHISCEFSTLSWEKTLTDIYYSEGDQMKPLTIYSRGISTPVSYTGEPLMQFWTTDGSSENNKEYVPIGQVQLPETAKQVLLVFFQSESVNKQLRVLALDNATEQFPIGTCRFFNFANKHIEGVYGQHRFTLASNEQSIVKLTKDKATVAVSVKLAYRSEHAWSLGYSSVWRNQPAKRLNVFVTEDPNNSDHLLVKKFHTP